MEVKAICNLSFIQYNLENFEKVEKVHQNECKYGNTSQCA